jgi:hypothetical protein
VPTTGKEKQMKKPVFAVLTILMMAAFASANEHGGGAPDHGMGPGGPGPEGAHAIVGSDGTIYLPTATTTGGTTTVSVKAIRSSGATAWTATLPAGARRLELSDGNLLTETVATASDGTVTTTLTAISTATGATAWTKAITGHVGDLVPFNGGTYVFVIVPPATSGGSATRSIIAIDNSGNTLWTVNL